jgi:hypothetical protein
MIGLITQPGWCSKILCDISAVLNKIIFLSRTTLPYEDKGSNRGVRCSHYSGFKTPAPAVEHTDEHALIAAWN